MKMLVLAATAALLATPVFAQQGTSPGNNSPTSAGTTGTTGGGMMGGQSGGNMMNNQAGGGMMSGQTGSTMPMQQPQGTSPGNNSPTSAGTTGTAPRQ